MSFYVAQRPTALKNRAVATTLNVFSLISVRGRRHPSAVRLTLTALSESRSAAKDLLFSVFNSRFLVAVLLGMKI